MSIMQFLWIFFHIGQPYGSPAPGAHFGITDPSAPSSPARSHYISPARPQPTQPAR